MADRSPTMRFYDIVDANWTNREQNMLEDEARDGMGDAYGRKDDYDEDYGKDGWY